MNSLDPARNIPTIKDAIGSSTVEAIHDPHMQHFSLWMLLNLARMETKFSPSLRLLGTAIWTKSEKLSLIDFLRRINVGLKATWEVRGYPETSKPHRCFLVLDDGSVVTCGTALHRVAKDEVLDREPAGSENAKHEQQFFDDNWKIGTTLS